MIPIPDPSYGSMMHEARMKSDNRDVLERDKAKVLATLCVAEGLMEIARALEERLTGIGARVGDIAGELRVR